jgi:hypothetical protein
VTLSTSVGEATEGGQPLIFNVDLDRITSQALTVSFQLGGSAGSGDYTVKSGTQVLSGSIVVPAGSSFASISVYPASDTLPEGDETVTVTITGVSSGGQLGTALARSGTIHNAGSSSSQGADAIPGTTATTATLGLGTTGGTIEQNDLGGGAIDHDYYKVTLIGGHRYTFSADANVSTSDTLDSVFIRLRGQPAHPGQDRRGRDAELHLRRAGKWQRHLSSRRQRRRLGVRGQDRAVRDHVGGSGRARRDRSGSSYASDNRHFPKHVAQHDQ